MEEREGGDWRELVELRSRIDEIDDSILRAIAARYRIAEDVGRLKRRASLPALDPRREAEIVRRASESARAAGIPDEGVRQIYWTLLDCCRVGVERRVGDSARAEVPSDSSTHRPTGAPHDG